jgi:hypothetical protein
LHCIHNTRHSNSDSDHTAQREQEKAKLQGGRAEQDLDRPEGADRVRSRP